MAASRTETEREMPVVGAVLLATDLTTERDIRRLAPPEARVCVTRIPYTNPTTPGNLRATLPHLTGAARLIAPGEPMAALYFACTSASVVLGHAALAAAVEAARPGVPVVTPTGAAAEALGAIGVRRLAILSPYLAETAGLVAGHFAHLGFEVAGAEALGLADDREMARLSRPALLAGARRAAQPGAEALFVACTAVPATALIAELEAAAGLPVVTANGAGLWQALRLAGLRPRPGTLGRLDHPHPAAAAS